MAKLSDDGTMPSEPTAAPLTHLDSDGRAHMVDVGDKPVTRRTAKAEALVRISTALESALRAQSLAKGDAFAVARLAGILAAKRTDELIPLCHTLPLDQVDVRLTLETGRVRIEGEVHTTARTGVEMEALTACAVAALTIVDMGKSIDRGTIIEGVRLLEKTGGRSGTWKSPS